MNQPMTILKNHFVIHILNGPDKGAQFKISGATLTIGRGNDNDIQVQGDPQISRQHLRISIRHEEIYIESLNEKNPLTINKKPIQNAIIESGVQFIAGKTKFQIKEENQISTTSQRNNMSPYVRQNRQGHQKLTPLPQKRNLARMTLYAVVGIVILLLIFSSHKKDETQEPMLRTDEVVNKEIVSQQNIIESLRQKNLRSGKSTLQFKRAQAGYIKGFRDYKQGQYERAIQYFQECLSIYPSHVLCNRYLRLSQKRFNELVQYHMVVGKKSLDKKHYRACITSFNNVMVMVKDPNDKVYIEAKSNYDICKYKYKDRF